MQLEGIPGVFEAILLLTCAALGGAMFGGIVASNGPFARKHTSPVLKHRFEEEIDRGHILVSVRAENVSTPDPKPRPEVCCV
jgi:hypothetical protein